MSDASPTATPDQPDRPERRKRRWLRRAVWAVLVLVGLAVLTGVVLNQVAASQRTALLERLDAAGITAGPDADETGDATTDPAWLIDAIEPSEDDAFKNDNLPWVGTRYALDVQQAYPEPMVEALRGVRPLLDTALDAIPPARPHDATAAARTTPADITGVVDRMKSVRGIARLLMMGVELAVLEDEPGLAAHAVADLRSVAQSLHGGVFIEALVEAGLRHLAAGAIEEALSRGQLSAAALSEIVDTLDAWRADTDLHNTLAAELRFTRRMLERGETADGTKIGRLPWLEALNAWPLVWMTRPIVDDFEAIAQRLPDDRVGLLTWAQERRDEPDGPESIWETSVLDRAVESYAWSFDDLAVAAAAMRVERYRLEHGDWPADLRSVLPDAPPRDWAGRDLVYRLEDGDALLYSLGTNGRDDGGEAAFGDGPSRADDHAAFRLFAPATRGTLPPPTPND